jgi:hypothetical protein
VSCSVHDIIWFEVHGRPSVFVASNEFIDAAEAQTRTLGLSETKRVFVPHPIQDANDDEMFTKADEAFDAIVEALTSAG